MANKKITAMPDLAGGQVSTDLITAVDLSASAANQNVKSTLGNIFTFLAQNQTDGLTRAPSNSSTANVLQLVNSTVAAAIVPADIVKPALLVFHTTAEAANYWSEAWWNETSSYYTVHQSLNNGFFRWTTYDKATDTVNIMFTIEPDNFVIAGASGNAVFRFALSGYQDIRKSSAPGSPAVADLRLWADSTSGFLQYKNSGGTIVVLNGSVPGGSNTQVQYNNSSAFGGISGLTSDGTNMTAGDGNLRATSPLITTGIDDVNGNTIIGFTSTGSAVNFLNVANAASGGHPVLSAAGSGSNINIVLTPKGTGDVVPGTSDTYDLGLSGTKWKAIWVGAGGVSDTRVNIGTAVGMYSDDAAGDLIIGDQNVTVFLRLKSGQVRVGTSQATFGGGFGAANQSVGFAWAGSVIEPWMRVTDGSTGVGVLIGGALIIARTATTNIVATDSGKVYTNEGATSSVTFNLPSAAANLTYTFIVQDTDGLSVVANTGDTIRIAGSVSASAGNISNTTIGSSVALVAINATEWIAISVIGTWTVT